MKYIAEEVQGTQYMLLFVKRARARAEPSLELGNRRGRNVDRKDVSTFADILCGGHKAQTHQLGGFADDRIVLHPGERPFSQDRYASLERRLRGNSNHLLILDVVGDKLEAHA